MTYLYMLEEGSSPWRMLVLTYARLPLELSLLHRLYGVQSIELTCSWVNLLFQLPQVAISVGTEVKINAGPEQFEIVRCQ